MRSLGLAASRPPCWGRGAQVQYRGGPVRLGQAIRGPSQDTRPPPWATLRVVGPGLRVDRGAVPGIVPPRLSRKCPKGHAQAEETGSRYAQRSGPARVSSWASRGPLPSEAPTPPPTVSLATPPPACPTLLWGRGVALKGQTLSLTRLKQTPGRRGSESECTPAHHLPPTDLSPSSWG